LQGNGTGEHQVIMVWFVLSAAYRVLSV